MSNQYTPQLRGVLELLEKKQSSPGNTDVETHFFNDALEYLLSNTVNHWWCTEATLPIARESLWLFSLPDHDPIVQYKKKLNSQLNSCTHCVQAYQTSKLFVRQRYDCLFPKNTVDEFFNCIDRFDRSRVFASLGNKESESFSTTNEVMCGILEVIYSPRLLKNSKCDDLFCKTFDLIQKTGSFPTFSSDTAACVFRMTVHHHRIIRFWARKLIEKFITTDGYSLTEGDLLQVKDLILGVLHTFTEDSEDEDFMIKLEGCPFTVSQDLGELWKSFRLVTAASSPDILLRCLSESNVSMPELIKIQLSGSAEWLSELLKTMTAMLLKMQDKFWGVVKGDSTPYYDIVKQICEHTVFQTAMKIAREGNTGRILQRDGSRYPDDKLMAKIKSMLEWIYPFWSSLRHSPVEKDITKKILDTTFGYFQMETWGVMSRAYCAELGLQIIDQCLVDNSVPVDKIDEYVVKIVGFAKVDASKLPELVKHMPGVARNILTDLMDRDSTSLNKAFNAIYQIDGLTDDDDTENTTTEEPVNSPYEKVWTSIRSCFDEDVKKFPWLAKILFKAYSNIASADIVNLLEDSSQNKEEPITVECRRLLLRFADIRTVVNKTLRLMADADWEIRKGILLDVEMTKPMLHLISSGYQGLQEDSRKFIQQYPRQLSDQNIFHDFFYLCKPLQVLEAFNSILREFIALNSSSKLNTFKSVPVLIHFLGLQVNTLTSTPSGYLLTIVEMGPGKVKDSEGILNDFWDVCWRTINIILEKALKWAMEYRPTSVTAIIVPTLDVATEMMANKKQFKNAIATTSEKEQVTLNFDDINTMIDSLSHWIYVTRQDVISRLVPLTISVLHDLKKLEIKISVEAYDRLMTAATGVNASKLTTGDRENLFMCLSAHEPTNFIYLNDDSDDEDVEWQAIRSDLVNPEEVSLSSAPPSSSISASLSQLSKKPARQMTLDRCFSNVSLGSTTSIIPKSTTPKITNYFAATATQPHEISDDEEIEEEFGDVDYSQIPEEWLTTPGTASEETSTHVSGSSSSNTVKQKGDVYFGDGSAMEIVEVPQINRKAVPIVPPSDNDTRVVVEPKPRQNQTRVYLPESRQPTFAVTSKGRKLRPPSMGFSKLKNLREEFKAERRLIATAKSPSAAGIVRQHYGVESSGSSSDSSSEEEAGDDSGLLGLIYDLDSSEPSVKGPMQKHETVQAESASVKALFDTKPKRTIKLLETPISNSYLDRKLKARVREQNRRQKITPSIDRLFKTVFSWDITGNSELPPNTTEAMLTRVSSTFKTFEEYRSTFEPLLILETWCQLLRSKEGLSQSDVMDHCIVEGRCHTNDFVDITFGVAMSMIGNNLSQDDLICVANHFGPSFFTDPYYSSDTEKTAWRGKAFLGKVMSINQKKNMGEVIVRCYFASDRISVLNSVSPKTQWHILRIMSLTTTMREYSALEGLEYYDLGQDIIQPKLHTTPKPTHEQVEQCRERYDVNEPQAEAIVSAIQKKKGFSLIQGPPGTGKTKTILSLIVSLLDQRTNATADQPYGTGKLLVCAPSNAAVDEITKRLKDGVLTAHGTRTPNVVRIGVADSVNASVKDRILDRLIEAEMDSSGGKNGAPGGKWGAKLDTLHQDIRDIQIRLDDVDRDITQSGSDMVQMSILRDKRKVLAQKLTRSKILLKDTYQDQKNHGKEMEISRVRARQKVFANADVVCATLSGSGHDMLTAMGVSFETVIVDEAAQSIEISSLIPLKFDTQRCILVGDPNQLPPTVMSTVATNYSYQQSLFMRLEQTVAKQVNLLSIQYRMHPEISRFPSKMFYQSRLLDGPDMEKASSAVWHSLPEFPPYHFFNIEDGQEKVGRGKSIYNVAEADAAVALVDMLCTKLPSVKFASKIGVITPYKQQVGQLKSKFQKRFGNNIVDVIDFNTVDGFQGQEKEIILFSCVRAGNGRGIGFLADMRRMNVGLTRAKCSLFVLGNCRSLSGSEYWGDLVRDAERRRLITNCSYPYFRHNINELSIPRNMFEKTVAVVKKKTVSYKRGPVKIAEPKSNPNSNSNSDEEDQQAQKIGGKRLKSSSGSRPSARRRIASSTSEDVEMEEATQPLSFIEKVRREKESIQERTPQTTSTINPPNKLSISDYRASRGLPPLAAGSSQRIPPPIRPTGNSGGSSLFIKKKAAPSRPRPVNALPEGFSAKEKAIMDHTAAKERLKSSREEERRREERNHSTPATPIRNLDSIIDDAQRSRKRNDDRRDHDRRDKYRSYDQNRHSYSRR